MKLTKEEKLEIRDAKKVFTSLMAVAKRKDALFEGNTTTSTDPNNPKYITTRTKLINQ